MRNFDNWLRYKDNNSKPLHGCVMFNVKDGNTTALIYDSDGTALNNPILTDEYGRTQHQVFVDTDVIAYFYKYIGQGNWTNQHDIDISDDTNWALQYTSESILDTHFELTSNAATCVNTIAELRALDVSTVPMINGYKVITLLGYNTCGDKEPINYVWYASSEDNDDNGAVIKSTALLTGRWKMVKPTEHCDSRHYGIFPRNTTNFVGDTARMLQWIEYCNAVNVRPYFSANGDYKYYKYNNLSFTAPEIDVANSVTFIDTGTSNIWTTEINGDPLFSNHATNLAANTVKTSWGAYAFINPKHVIVDNTDTFYNTNLSNCIVDINVSCDKVCAFNECTVNVNAGLHSISSFTKCNINSIAQITAGCYFLGCKLTEDMFYGSPFIHVDGNCIADFNDFEHKQLMWLRIKEQQQQINYDWEGVLTQQNPWEGRLETDRWLINYKSVNVDAVMPEGASAHVYYLENCAGTITIEGKAENTYVFKDCDMNVKLANDAVTGITISIQNSNMNFSQDMNVRHFSMRNSSVNCLNNTLTCDHFTSYGSFVSMPVMARDAVVKDSQINAQFSLIAHVGIPRTVTYLGGLGGNTQVTAEVSHFISGYLDNNIFNGQFVIDGQWGLMGDSTQHSVIPYTLEQCLVESLVFTNNISNYAGDAWYIWANMGAWRDDSLHNYIWKNNVGKFECKTTLTATLKNNVQDSTNPGVFCTLAASNAWGKWCSSELVTDPVVGLTEEYIDLGNRYFCTMDLFSIGTLNVHFDLEFWLEGETSSEESMSVNAFTNGNPAGIAHLNDKCICGPFEYIPKGSWEGARTSPFKVADVRNVNCIATLDYAPILTPAGDFAWSKTFQIRNFAVGSTINFADSTQFTMHIKQL